MSFSFGSATSAPNTGFGAAAKPSFSFGSTNTATTSTAGFSGFGTATSASTAAPAFGAFGTAAATSSAAPFGTLGSVPASSAPSLFGGSAFGNTAAKPAGFGAGFGTGTNAFGTTNFASGAGTFGTNTLGANTFGTSNFGTNSTFGSTFGKPAVSGFGGFGSGLGTTNTFGQQQQQQQQQLQQQQQQQQGPASAHEALVAAVFNCNVFGDERDQVLAKWNLIQAQWGIGQAYYNRNAPPLELNEQNPLCRFKAVGYARLGGKEDKDGHVAMVFSKPEQEIKTNQQQLINSLSGLLGNKPNLAVTIDSVKAISDNKTQIVIFVVDNNAGGSHISASELANFLNTAGPRAALAGAGCGAAAADTAPPAHAREQYLKTSPQGMDARLWKQAQADNPDPEKYIPVPITGFSEIKFRARCQSEQAALQAGFLRAAGEQLAELRARRAAVDARLQALHAKHHALRHTLLQVVARQEVGARVGAGLSADEEAARARLHDLAQQLSQPPAHNGRLNELLCAVRLQRSASGHGTQERYQLDPGAEEDLKQFLTLQQRGMAHLLDTARADLAALNTIAEGMAKLVRA